MRTDIELQRDVADELRWDPSVRDHEIGVVVRDGVVTLTGAVDSYAQKLAAERAVERIVGVRAVADDLEVQLPSIHLRTDTAIAHAVVDALAWNIDVPNERIRVKVANGWVTLHGTVEWEYQREAAEQAVSALSGVRGVVNEIVVEPGVPSPENVSLEIHKALRRHADVDADAVEVTTRDGEVILSGAVQSWAEREEAERAAWAAPGVKLVVNEIAIRP